MTQHKHLHSIARNMIAKLECELDKVKRRQKLFISPSSKYVIAQENKEIRRQIAIYQSIQNLNLVNQVDVRA